MDEIALAHQKGFKPWWSETAKFPVHPDWMVVFNLQEEGETRRITCHLVNTGKDPQVLPLTYPQAKGFGLYLIQDGADWEMDPQSKHGTTSSYNHWLSLYKVGDFELMEGGAPFS